MIRPAIVQNLLPLGEADGTHRQVSRCDLDKKPRFIFQKQTVCWPTESSDTPPNKML